MRQIDLFGTSSVTRLLKWISVETGAAGYPANDPPGTVPFKTAAVGSQEDWPFTAFTDRQVNRPGRPQGNR